MRLTDGDLQHLFRFGMAMQRLDERDEFLLRGRAEPHPDNRDCINLWVTEGANSVLPREVEPDDLGGYRFTDAQGGRRRIFPLPEAQRVSFGTWDGAFASSDTTPGDDTDSSAQHGASGPGLADEDHRSPEMVYFLVHYALNQYPWGVWRSPSENYYGDNAHPIVIQHGTDIVASRDVGLSWPEWIDSIASNPPGTQDRWDMYKTTEPEQLDTLLTRLQGGQTYAQWVLSGRGD